MSGEDPEGGYDSDIDAVQEVITTGRGFGGGETHYEVGHEGFGGDSEIPSVESISAVCSFSRHFPYFGGTRAEPWIPTWPSRRGGAR